MVESSELSRARLVLELRREMASSKYPFDGEGARGRSEQTGSV